MSLNISQVSVSEKCGYLNARKLLFQNTLRESTCSRVLKTGDTTVKAVFSKLSIGTTDIELMKVCASEIWNLGSVWKHVDCRWYVFSSLDEKNLRNRFHCHYLKNGKHFLEFLLHFLNVHKFLCILKKSISAIAYIFWKLVTARYVVAWMLESSFFRTPFPSERFQEY